MSTRLSQTHMKRKVSGSAHVPPTKRMKTTGNYQQGRELAKTPKSELKAFDVTETNINFVVPAGPPVPTTLSAMVNGAELYQRIGRKIYMKSIHIRGFVNLIATSTEDFLRIIVYYDSQPNGVAPALTDIIQDSTAAHNTTIMSGINLNNRQRFKILRDHQMHVPNLVLNAGVVSNESFPQTDDQLNINFFIKLKGLEAVYNAVNGGTVADITSGAIGIICFSGSSNNSWELSFSSRLRYYD